MRHLYVCPLRWADLDLIGHVNNVTYVDYLQEARVDMLRTHAPDKRADDLAEGVVVARNAVTYVAPLTLRDSVAVECWVTEIRAASFTMAYEVFDTDDDGNRITFLRARSLLTPFVFSEERPRRISDEERASLSRFLEPEEPFARLAPTVPDPDRDAHWPVAVRFSDVDVFGHVNNVKYFEYFQEARIATLGRLFGQLPPDDAALAVVVAQMDVEYKRPVLFRPEPYDAWSWISRVGRTSYDVSAGVFDGDELLARSRCTMVAFDPATQRAAQPSPAYRELLVEHLRG
ncbi:hotdog domain-containing protein [Nocardioides zeae]|uniref:Hotdog domain-containing protein n=1 Tax=Nocardioides imazamoxiresistens TaxID=3231893 RepID=A0ABU3PRP8_9ACTN|nr:thioesterase family protein [Nocardioides zeae]MDT9591901.1 hotdog domain-containing protein [Nocardioides zeae]